MVGLGFISTFFLSNMGTTAKTSTIGQQFLIKVIIRKMIEGFFALKGEFLWIGEERYAFYTKVWLRPTEFLLYAYLSGR